MIRSTTSGLARAQGLSRSVRHTLSGDVPRMLGLHDFIVEANQKAGVSGDQAAQRLQVRLQKRVENLVQREAAEKQQLQRSRQRPHSAAPFGRSTRASQRPIASELKPSWNPTATRASTYDELGSGATKRFSRGGGGRIGRSGTSRRTSRSSRSRQLSPMSVQQQQQQDIEQQEMRLWEQNMQQQASDPDAGQSVFGAWSDEYTNDGAACSNGSTAISTPDTPPLSPSPSLVKSRRPQGGVMVGQGDVDDVDVAVRELAEAVRPEWGNVVLALRRASGAAADSTALSAADIVRVLQGIPAVSKACDAAMINAVVHHMDSQHKEGGARSYESKQKRSMGYIGLLQQLMRSLQPSNPASKEQPRLEAAPVQAEDESSVVPAAPWQTQKIEAVAAPKRQTQNFDKNAELMVHPGVAQPYEKRVVRKRVLESLKGGSLRHAFREMDTDGNGVLSRRELREALWKLDIDMDDDAFDEMVAAIDTDHSGEIDFAEFKSYFTSGRDAGADVATSSTNFNVSAASTPMGVIVSMPLMQCVALIQDKVRARLQGGPAELRRAFQFFDTNGSGKIDRDEFIAGLKHRCGLVFAPALMGRIWLHFTEGGGGLSAIDYSLFCRTVCGSSQNDDTTFNSASRSLSRATANDMGNTMQFVSRRMREHWKDLRRDLNFAVINDPAGDGLITAEALRSILYRYNIILQDETFASLVLEVSDPNKQAERARISHERFLSQFRNGSPHDTLTSAVVRLATNTSNSYGNGNGNGNGNGKNLHEGVVNGDLDNACGVQSTVSSADIKQAHRMLQDVIRGRLCSGPSELRRAFKLFDRSADGKIDHGEWCIALRRHLGLAFEQPLCDALFTKFAQKEEVVEEADMTQRQKYIDYHSFCHHVMESKPGGHSGTGLNLQTRVSRLK
eukprot:COSAG02_NODE_2443_length_8852_cov_63.348795_7_plen_903_part_00